MIISGQAEQSTALYQRADYFVKSLKEEEDYVIDIESKTISLTEQGVDKAEAVFHLDNLYDVENGPLIHHIDTALRANYIMIRDIDYVVQEDEVRMALPVGLWKGGATRMASTKGLKPRKMCRFKMNPKPWPPLPSKITSGCMTN